MGVDVKGLALVLFGRLGDKQDYIQNLVYPLIDDLLADFAVSDSLH